MASRVMASAALACVLAACGGSGGAARSAVSTLPATPTSAAPATPTSATPATPVLPTASTVPAGGEGALSVLVSASGGGGLLGTPGIADVVVDDAADATTPWIRFDLVVPYQALEANTVVFAEDGGTRTAGDPPQVRIDGPLCTGPVVCDDGGRSVAIVDGASSVLSFEVFRGGDLAPLAAGSLTAEVDAVFDFAHPAVDDQPITFTLRLDLVPAAAGPAGDTTPRDTGAAAVTVIGGGLGLLTFPVLALADTPDDLRAALAPSLQPIDVEALAEGVDWRTHAVVVVAIPTDACPPVLAGLAIDGGVARPSFVDPGYTGCVEPLLSHTSIAAVDRSLLQDVGRLELPAHQPFFDRPVTVVVDVEPSSGTAPTSTIDAEFGEQRGSAALPPRGEATVAALDDGAPVIVVRHHDGTVSALDPRAASSSSSAPSEPASLSLVRWIAGSRHFLGGGAWDEYGRRLDGFRDTDLQGFATRVDDGQVEIGGPVDAPVGAPIAATADPPAMADVAVTPADALPLDAAVALGAGRSAWVDADVVIGPEGAFLCDAPTVDGSIEIDACPSGSPAVDGIDAVDGFRSVWFGPLLVTRTESGFSGVAATGGYAGVAL